MPKTHTLSEQNEDAETARRRDAIIKQMIGMPPAPHVSPKPKKKVKRTKSANRKPRK